MSFSMMARMQNKRAPGSGCGVKIDASNSEHFLNLGGNIGGGLFRYKLVGQQNPLWMLNREEAVKSEAEKRAGRYPRARGGAPAQSNHQFKGR